MGQMNKPLFDLDTPGVQAELASYTPGQGLAWPQLFPLKYTPKFDLKGIEGEDGIPVSADRVAFNSKAPKKTRKKVGSWNCTLGKIEISREKDEIDINEYNDLKTIAAANTEDTAAAQGLVDLVYDDIAFCNKGLDARVEIEALTIGSLGKRVFSTTLDGDMAESEEINFNVPEDNFLGAVAKWDNYDTADGLADIIRGAKLITKKGLQRPQYAIMEQSMFDHLCAQKKTIKRVASAILKATGLDSADDVTLESVNSYMRRKSAPQILVVDPYVVIEGKDSKKTTVQPWNVNSVVLSPEARLGYTYYKTVPRVPNSDALQEYGSYYKLTVYSELNPMLEVTMGEAYIQPALSNRRSLVFINAMHTEWNGGEA